MDLDLVLSQVRAGSDSAFCELSDAYLGLIHKLALRYFDKTAEAQDYEDAVQEAHIRLFKAACSFDPDAGLSFGLYAQICIRNGLISMKRKKAGEPAYSECDISELELAVPDTTLQIEENESAKLFWNKVAEVLSDSELDVLKLRVLKKSRAEIADALGCSEKSVDNAIFRIKKKLRALLF